MEVTLVVVSEAVLVIPPSNHVLAFKSRRKLGSSQAYCSTGNLPSVNQTARELTQTVLIVS